MKNIKMYGKSIPLIAIVLVGLLTLGASAVLVSYLSTPVSTDVTLSSPVTFRLYDDLGAEITDETITAQILGGESFDFIKIAHNDAENAIPFAIALVIKGADVGVVNEFGAAVMVDSAGPVSDTAKTNIGTTQPWDSVDWHQNEGEAWYLHGAHDQDMVDAYSYYGELSTGIAFTNPLNEMYVDAVALTLVGEDYYVVIFGGTIGDSLSGDVGPRDETDLVTNWGFGGAAGYTLRGQGDIPITVPADDGSTDPHGYDVGKVRVIFSPSYFGTVEIGMQLVVPGSTIQQVIDTVLGP